MSRERTKNDHHVADERPNGDSHPRTNRTDGLAPATNADFQWRSQPIAHGVSTASVEGLRTRSDHYGASAGRRSIAAGSD